MFAFIREQKAFTAFLTTLVIIGTFGAVLAAPRANAETVLLNVTDTLSTSVLSKQAKHTIKFTPVNPLPGNSGAPGITIGFTSGDFGSINTIAYGDVSMTQTGSTYVAKAACDASAGAFTVDSSVADEIRITVCNNASVASGTPITIDIGTGANKIVNPSSIGSQEVTIALANQQSQKVRVAIIDNVLMTASVDPILSFSVAGTSTGVGVNGTTTNTGTTASTIDFGTLPVNTAKVAAQDLTISTNARNGFNVTVQTDSQFKSANGATIEGFLSEGASSTPSAWAAPTALLNNDKTWGHLGLTTSDITNTAVSGSNLWVGNFIMNPVTVFSQASSTKNQHATVGYQVQISDLQEAATDYQTNVVYVATPIF